MEFNWGFLLKNIHMAKLIQLPTSKTTKGNSLFFKIYFQMELKEYFIYTAIKKKKEVDTAIKIPPMLLYAQLGLVKYMPMMVLMSKFSCLTLLKNA